MMIAIKDIDELLNTKRKSLYQQAYDELVKDFIINEVCSIEGVSFHDLISQSRKRHITDARKICIYLIRFNTKISLVKIGEILGGRDHSTAIYSLNVMSDFIDVNNVMRNKINDYQNRINLFKNVKIDNPVVKMKTKEEVIREAWKDNYEEFKEHINADGWAIYPNFQKHEMIEGVGPVEINVAGNWRPKSLKGIEDNNGWTKISSRNDLPTDKCEYFVLTKEGIIKEADFNPLNLVNKIIWENNYTHYQKKVIPDFPIY